MTYFATTEVVKVFLQMLHLNGRSSSSSVMTYFETTGLVKVFLQMVTFEWKIFIKGNDLLCNHRAGEGIFADVTFEWKIFFKRNDLL